MLETAGCLCGLTTGTRVSWTFMLKALLSRVLLS